MRLIRKGLLISLGLGAITKAKAQEVVKALIAKGEVSSKEGKALINKILKESLKEHKRIKQEVKNQVKKTIGEFSSLSKKELRNLAKRVGKLEKGKRKGKKK